MIFVNAISYMGTNKHTKESLVEKVIGSRVDEFETFFKIHNQLEKNKSAVYSIKPKQQE